MLASGKFVFVAFALVCAALPASPAAARTWVYRVTVETGKLENSGTDSSIQMKLIGDNGESRKRLLDKPNKNDFETGAVDTYEFAEDKDLGDINTILVFHDNSGKKPGWYLDRIIVRDPRNKTAKFSYENWIPTPRNEFTVEILEDGLKQDPYFDEQPIVEEHIGYTYDEAIDNRFGSQPFRKAVDVTRDISNERLTLTDTRTNTVVKASGSGGVNLGIFHAGASGSYKMDKYLRTLDKQDSKERLRVNEKITWVVPAHEILVAQYGWKVKKRRGTVKWGSKVYPMSLVDELRYDVTLVTLSEVNGRIAIPSTINDDFKKELRRRFPNTYVDEGRASKPVAYSHDAFQAIKRAPIALPARTPQAGAAPSGAGARPAASDQAAAERAPARPAQVAATPAAGVQPAAEEPKPLKPIVPAGGFQLPRTMVDGTAPGKEDCVGLNPRSSTVSGSGGRWKIVDGKHALFDFGNKQDEAHKALRVIQHYGVTQSCFVGRPGPSLKYLLVAGNAPSGALGGEDCIAFNPATTEVKEVQGRWKIADGSHWLFDFEGKQDEARQALAVIKRHGFTHSCFVGRPDPSLQYLRK